MYKVSSLNSKSGMSVSSCDCRSWRDFHPGRWSESDWESPRTERERERPVRRAGVSRSMRMSVSSAVVAFCLPLDLAESRRDCSCLNQVS